MTPEQRKEAVDKLFKDLNGKVDAETLSKAQSMLDPTKPETEPLLTALSTGLHNSYMAQADYARKTQELAEQRRTVERLQQEFNDKTEALQIWQEHLQSNAVSKADFDHAQQQIQLLEQQKLAAERQLTELGLELDPNKGVPMNPNPNNPNPTQPSQPNPNPAPNPNPNPRDPNRYFTVDQFQQAANEMVGGTLLESAKQAAMMQEHQALTGKPLDIVGLTSEAIAQGKTPAKYWEEKFNIPTLRQEAQAKALEQQIEYRANELMAKKLSETRQTGQQSMFQNAGSLAYRAAGIERGADNAPRPSDSQMSAMQATDAAVKEYEALTATGKFSDGQTMQEAQRMLGI